MGPRPPAASTRGGANNTEWVLWRFLPILVMGLIGHASFSSARATASQVREVVKRLGSCAHATPSLAWSVMTIDFRTRDDVDAETIDVAGFFGSQLPRLAAERSSLAVPGARELGVRPFTIETSAGTWTLSVDDDAIRVEPGGTGHASVRLDADEITDIVHDRRTPMTLLAAATLDMPSGNINHFLDWWVVLRSLLDGRAVHTAGDVTFTDRDGSPLDLQRSFRVDDDPAELAYYLGEAGYLHLTEVFTTDEMAQVSADMDAALPRYHDGDGRSWWATTADGKARGTPAAVPGREPGDRELAPGRPAPAPRLTLGRRARAAGPGRQQDRGARQAHRRREGHFRPALAQGLQPRAALLALLQRDGWDLGHRRRRTLGAARGRGRFPPGSRPAHIFPRLLGPAGSPTPDQRRRRHPSLLVHYAHEPCASGAGTPRHVHRLRPAPSRR